MSLVWRTAALTLAFALMPACDRFIPPPPNFDLGSMESWAIQLQGIEEPGAVAALAECEAELVVIDAVSTERGRGDYPMSAVVSRVRGSRGATLPAKLCLAYLNVGQAEDYRSYWTDSWRAPREDGPGEPEFILAADPDGWPGNWPVAYWDPRWQSILSGSADSLLEGIIDHGFDGVMLDWVTAWTDPRLVQAAAREGVDPAPAMAALIRGIAERGRALRPGFLVLLNDGAPLLTSVPDLATIVDGVVREDVSYSGGPSSRWDDPGNADQPVEDTEEIIGRLVRVRLLGVVIFTLDYASRPALRDEAIRRARENDFVPCVSRTPLDRLP